MRTILAGLLVAMLTGATVGCSRPNMPSLTGPGLLHDFSQIRKGMSSNEVCRIMGSKYQVIYEEGLQGMDGGNYIWEYPDGRVYFNMDGVVRVQPYK
ncbi:MAG: hypothetical protein V1899_04145 [Planctomycetota bacterium]